MKNVKVSVSTNGTDFKEIDMDKMANRAENILSSDNDPEVAIKAATLKGDFCNYKYEITSGKMKGDTLDRKGVNIVHNDLKKAFKKLHVHLALACEELDASSIKDVDNIPEWDADAVYPKNLTALQEVSRRVFHFSVSSFNIDGTGENEGIDIIGSKRLTTGEFVKLGSPKIPWDGEYHFINELRVIAADIQHEVSEYMNGKFAPKYEQGELGFEENEGGGDGKIED